MLCPLESTILFLLNDLFENVYKNKITDTLRGTYSSCHWFNTPSITLCVSYGKTKNAKAVRIHWVMYWFNTRHVKGTQASFPAVCELLFPRNRTQRQKTNDPNKRSRSVLTLSSYHSKTSVKLTENWMSITRHAKRDDESTKSSRLQAEAKIKWRYIFIYFTSCENQSHTDAVK